METVHVNLGPRSYDIEIGSGNLNDVAKFCDAEQDDAHAVIITDSNVDELYSEPVGDALQEAGAQVDILVVEAGRAEQVARRGGRSLGAVARSRRRSQDGRRRTRRRRRRRPGRFRGGDVQPRPALRASSHDAARPSR